MRVPHAEPVERIRKLAHFDQAVQDLAYRVESTRETLILTDDQGVAVAAVVPAAALDRLRRDRRQGAGLVPFSPPIHSN